MLFVPLYPNAVAPDKIIDNLISLLGDAEYQAGAHEWAGDATLEPYVLISESAVWREDQETPALFIKDVTSDGDEDYPRFPKTLRFTAYLWLSVPHGEGAEDALKGEAYKRTEALVMMILSAKKSGVDVFDGTDIDMGKDVQVKRRNFGDAIVKGGSYFRMPSVDVEIKFEEAV